MGRPNFLLWLIGPLLAWGLAYLLLSDYSKLLIMTPLAAGVMIMVFRANESLLPLLVVLTLAMGSSYRWDVSEKSAPIRFFILFLVALRGVILFLSSKRNASQATGTQATPVHVGFLLTGILGIISVLYSVNPSLSGQRAISFLLLFFVIFIYFSIRTKSSQDCMGYATSLWRSLAIVLGVGYLFLLLRVPGMFSAGRLRLIVQNPNQLGHYCAIMAPLAAWYLFNQAQGKQRRIAWGVLGALFLAIVWSGSRGALITSFLSLLVQFALCYREKLLAVVLLVGLAASVHFLMGDPAMKPGDDPSFFEENLLRQKTLETGSGRTGVWKSAGRLIEKRPFFGHGFGIVDWMFKKGYFPDLPIAFQGGHVHNSYIEELVNLGWIGASFLFFSIAYLLFVGAGAVFKPGVVTPGYQFACALYASILAGALSGIFESWFTSVGSVFCFPFWLISMLFLKMVFRFNDWQAVRS